MGPSEGRRPMTEAPGDFVTGSFLVGTAGFEPATSSSRTMRATKLRHVPKDGSVVAAGYL